jgi:hypothetical protein
MKKITINLLVIFFVGILTVKAQITYMGLVGDATPIGWTPKGLAMEQDPTDSNIFTYKGPLKPGNFKIHLAEDDWCVGNWINAAVANQDLTATNYITTTGCDGPDNQWVVSTKDNYSIVVNLNAGIETITISTLNHYANLYLVGDATPKGWDISNATPLIVDGSNSALFSWSGSLTAGAFKITTAKSFDSGWDWIHPLTQSQDLNLTTYEILASGSGSDNQWLVSNADDYNITINLQNATIDIQQAPLSVEIFTKIKMHPNPVSNYLSIDMSNLDEAKVSVFDINGRILLEKEINSNSNYIDLTNIKSRGLIFIKISNDKYSEVFKIIKK